jgi:hypothetical protein
MPFFVPRFSACPKWFAALRARNGSGDGTSLIESPYGGNSRNRGCAGTNGWPTCCPPQTVAGHMVRRVCHCAVIHARSAPALSASYRLFLSLLCRRVRSGRRSRIPQVRAVWKNVPGGSVCARVSVVWRKFLLASEKQELPAPAIPVGTAEHTQLKNPPFAGRRMGLPLTNHALTNPAATTRMAAGCR